MQLFIYVLVFWHKFVNEVNDRIDPADTKPVLEDMVTLSSYAMLLHQMHIHDRFCTKLYPSPTVYPVYPKVTVSTMTGSLSDRRELNHAIMPKVNGT